MTTDAHAEDTSSPATAQTPVATAADTPTAGAPATDSGPARGVSGVEPAMSAPRFCQHTDGRTAVLHVGWEEWFVLAPSSKWGCRTRWEADVTGDGWSEAVLVPLPEPATDVEEVSQ